MKIGIFDSGLGGLVIAKAIFKKLPAYDYLYLGDTKNLPYGNKTQSEILKLTESALRLMFEQDCGLVIIACNTSSAKALRIIQQRFLPKYYPQKKVLGVIVPTLESIPKASSKVAILATTSTVNSHAYKKELSKLRPKVKILEQSAPKLVPLIEANRINDAARPLAGYLRGLMGKKVDTLILGCTHYPLLIKQIRNIVGKKVSIISQEAIVPPKLKNYLFRHKDISAKLSKSHKKIFEVTKRNRGFEQVANALFGKKVALKKVNI
jgi:glutamate racemase